MNRSVRNISARSFIRALEKDGFICTKTGGSHRIYKHPDRGTRISVPYHHSGESLRPGTLAQLVRTIGWTEEDMIRLGLVRK